MDTGNLVQSTLISKEYLDLLGLKLVESTEYYVGTADKSSAGLKILGRCEQVEILLDGMDQAITLNPTVVDGLSLQCSKEGARIVKGKGGGLQQTCLVKGSRQPFPFYSQGRIIQRPGGNFNKNIHQVWTRGNQRLKWINSISKETENVIYAKGKECIPAWETRLIKVTSSTGVDGVCYISEELPKG